MNARHTRGPWETLPEEAGKAYIRVRGTRLGATYKIANVLVHTYPGALDYELHEARANARLIAAAPDLLEALLVARDHIDMGALEISHCKDAACIRAAIAKAGG